jgi:ribokinase
MKTRRIVVVGSANTDMIIRLKRIPRPGETILGGEFFTAAGGKGANQAVSAARAGGSVSFVARLGQDTLGDQAVAGYARDRIDIAHVVRDPKRPSGVGLIFLEQGGQNSIAVASGANDRLSPTDVRQAAGLFEGAGILLLQLEIPLPTIQAAVRLAVQAGTRVILNPAPARALPDKLLRQVSIVTPNETEAELLTGIRVSSVASAARAAAVLRGRSIATVIITLGARGAFVSSDGIEQLVPGFKVRAVDTTAAGDIFNGALAVALAENQPLTQAIRFANAAAAISVTRLGAQPSAPPRRQIERFIRSRAGQ